MQFAEFMRQFLQVKTDDGKPIPFELNKAQKEIFKRIEQNKGPIRMVLLKPKRYDQTRDFVQRLTYLKLAKPRSQGVSKIIIASATSGPDDRSKFVRWDLFDVWDKGYE